MTETDPLTQTGAGSAAPARDAVGRLRAGLEVLAVLGIFLVAANLLAAGLGIFFAPLGIWAGVVLGAFLLRRSGSSYRAIGFAVPRPIGRSVLAGLGLGLALILGLQLVHAAAVGLGGLEPVDVTSLAAILEGDPVAYALFMVLVVWGSAAVGEELFARGFVMHRFEAIFRGARLTVPLAALAQAALFAALHAYQGPTGFFTTGFAALVTAWAYYAAGRNLWVPILAHGVVDSYAVTLLFLGRSPFLLG